MQDFRSITLFLGMHTNSTSFVKILKNNKKIIIVFITRLPLPFDFVSQVEYNSFQGDSIDL